jgi:hypothetical protein
MFVCVCSISCTPKVQLKLKLQVQLQVSTDTLCFWRGSGAVWYVHECMCNLQMHGLTCITSVQGRKQSKQSKLLQKQQACQNLTRLVSACVCMCLFWFAHGACCNHSVHLYAGDPQNQAAEEVSPQSAGDDLHQQPGKCMCLHVSILVCTWSVL